MARWRNLFVLLLIGVWAIAAHIASAQKTPTNLYVAIAIIPLAVAGAVLTWQSPWPRLNTGALFLVGGGLLWLNWSGLRAHLPWLYYLQHLGAHLVLAAWFGGSLLPGRDPLITALARRIATQPLSPRALRYTRHVTVAWMLFLLANALVSTLLFAWSNVDIWSVYTNLLTAPLIAAFFALEMLVRVRVLPAKERPSIAAVIDAWRAHRHHSRASGPSP